MNNQKNISIAVTMYTQDNNSWTFSPYMNSAQWPRWLNYLGYLPDQAPAVADGRQSIFVCPTQTPYGNYDSTNYTYGMRYPTMTGYYLLSGGQIKMAYENGTVITYNSWKNPGDVILFADSRSGSSENQWYCFDSQNPATTNAKRIHTRHNNGANSLFADMHVETINEAELYNHGIMGYIDYAGNYSPTN